MTRLLRGPSSRTWTTARSSIVEMARGSSPILFQRDRLKKYFPDLWRSHPATNWGVTEAHSPSPNLIEPSVAKKNARLDPRLNQAFQPDPSKTYSHHNVAVPPLRSSQLSVRCEKAPDRSALRSGFSSGSIQNILPSLRYRAAAAFLSTERKICGV
jgi:hypothetical protein